MGHANAALTQRQRAQVQEAYRDGKTQTALAQQYGVHRRTIQRWIGRKDTKDRSSAPKRHGRRVVSEDYRSAVLAARQAHPEHGPKRIAYEFRSHFSTANVATIWRILKAAGASRREAKKRLRCPIPVGRHRVQLDIQVLSAIRGVRANTRLASST